MYIHSGCVSNQCFVLAPYPYTSVTFFNITLHSKCICGKNPNLYQTIYHPQNALSLSHDTQHRDGIVCGVVCEVFDVGSIPPLSLCLSRIIATILTVHCVLCVRFQVRQTWVLTHTPKLFAYTFRWVMGRSDSSSPLILTSFENSWLQSLKIYK